MKGFYIALNVMVKEWPNALIKWAPYFIWALHCRAMNSTDYSLIVVDVSVFTIMKCLSDESLPLSSINYNNY